MADEVDPDNLSYEVRRCLAWASCGHVYTLLYCTYECMLKQNLLHCLTQVRRISNTASILTCSITPHLPDADMSLTASSWLPGHCVPLAPSIHLSHAHNLPAPPRNQRSPAPPAPCPNAGAASAGRCSGHCEPWCPRQRDLPAARDGLQPRVQGQRTHVHLRHVSSSVAGSCATCMCWRLMRACMHAASAVSAVN